MRQALFFSVRDQRQPGWFFVDNELIDNYAHSLGAYGVAVYSVLCRRCKPTTQQVTNLSQRDIGAILGISQDRVRKSLIDLVQLNLIHIDIPEHPSPGVISTITLLTVKTAERHTLSSAAQLNAIRSRNKEGETKTETKTELPPTPLLEWGISTIGEIWQEVCGYLKDDLNTAFVNTRHFHESAYDKYFRDAWLVRIGCDVAILDSRDRKILREGVEKFQRRLLNAFRSAVQEIVAVRVSDGEMLTLEVPA
jgi:hypothetical protein